MAASHLPFSDHFPFPSPVVAGFFQRGPTFQLIYQAATTKFDASLGIVSKKLYSSKLPTKEDDVKHESVLQINLFFKK